MIILENGEHADPLWGMDTEIITDEMIEALEQGKRLYLSVNDEYAVVIKKNSKQKQTDSDTISRQAAINALDCINGVEEVLRALPSSPIRQKGQWEMVSQHGNPPTYIYSCSECRHKSFGFYNYCPNCGAYMQEGNV